MKNGQLAVLCITIVGAVAVLIWALAPPERLAAIRGTFSEKSPQELCLDLARERLDLKDPDSAKIVSYTTTANGDIEIKFKATNGFGAYVTDEYGCSIYKDSATWSSAQIDREMAKAGLKSPISSVPQRSPLASLEMDSPMARGAFEQMSDDRESVKILRAIEKKGIGCKEVRLFPQKNNGENVLINCLSDSGVRNSYLWSRSFDSVGGPYKFLGD